MGQRRRKERTRSKACYPSNIWHQNRRLGATCVEAKGFPTSRVRHWRPFCYLYYSYLCKVISNNCFASAPPPSHFKVNFTPELRDIDVSSFVLWSLLRKVPSLFLTFDRSFKFKVFRSVFASTRTDTCFVCTQMAAVVNRHAETQSNNSGEDSKQIRQLHGLLYYYVNNIFFQCIIRKATIFVALQMGRTLSDPCRVTQSLLLFIIPYYRLSDYQNFTLVILRFFFLSEGRSSPNPECTHTQVEN